MADDAVPLEHTAGSNAESGVLSRAYERAREAELASAARAEALAVDLAAVRAALEGEQTRSRELERIAADRSGAADAARSRIEEALREAERFRAESRGLREALGLRDASIAQLKHSLGERDAQLSALQREHAKVVPALEATAKSTSQLEAELQAAGADANALGVELEATRQAAAALASQLKRRELEINATRYDLDAAKIQAGTYLDVLRTREWRRGFDQNLWRESEAQVGPAHAGEDAHAAHARPVPSIEADVQRLTTELAVKSAANAEFDDENRKLRVALERARAALAERDVLIRGLQSGESEDAAPLAARIPAPVARPESVPRELTAAQARGAPRVRSGEMIRIAGEGPAKHVLARHTRIGRVPGCDLQIDSPSVSRYHALVHVGDRDTVIEDLGSTNGVLVNGRKVTRHVLCDGDEVTLGESHFRYVSRPLTPEVGRGTPEPLP